MTGELAGDAPASAGETAATGGPDSGASGLIFHRYPRRRHALVFALMALLCALAYGPAINADFQFDDEPNITACPAVQAHVLNRRTLWRAITRSKAPNRVLVSLSFALQHWGAQYLPRLIDEDPPRPALIPWQFRLFNLLVHVTAGMAVYLLCLRLLQLPRVERHYTRHSWFLAAAAALAWFASPVQTQAVTYIVQRATSMATLFYVLGLVSYLEARRGDITPARRYAFLLLVPTCYAAAMFCKEIAITLPVALVMLEYLLLRSPATSARYLLGMLPACALVALLALGWFYGGKGKSRPTAAATARVTPASSMRELRRALGRFLNDLAGKVFRDEVTNRKVGITPRQRLLTETRVVAMYQSLLFFPAPWRLNLDYDFPESMELFLPADCGHPADWLPLLLVASVALACLRARPRRRARVFLLLLVILGAVDALAALLGDARPPLLSRTWTGTWPVPALAWHLLLLGAAALYSFRRPLLAFCIVFFYLGQVVESTVICLEVVFEHRLYLPSIGFYLAICLLVYEALYPPVETDLGPRPLGSPR